MALPIMQIRWNLLRQPFRIRKRIKLMADEKKMFKVTIDNIKIEVEPGTSILNAARRIGGDVAPPAMCYYSYIERERW